MPPISPSQPHHRRRRASRWLKRVGLAAGACAIVGALVYAWIPKPIVVDLATAQLGPLDVEVVEDGQTRVTDRFVVYAPLGGELLRVEIDPGTAVDVGSPVATIAPSPAALLDPRTRNEVSARVAAAEARERALATRIDRAQAALELADKEAERAKRLQERDAITLEERDRTELSARLARADLSAAERERATAHADVEAARATLAEPSGGGRNHVQVTSPARGNVLKVLRDSEGPIAAGTPLLEIGDPRRLEVVVDVLSSDAAQITPGMPVTFEQWGGSEPLHGRVMRVEPSAFTRVSALGVEEQRVNVICTIGAPAGIGDGFRVTARIRIWHADRTLVIPSSAVFRQGGFWAVYVSYRGHARLRLIEVGRRGQTDVQVTSGLVSGERVILHPGDAIEPGRRIATR